MIIINILYFFLVVSLHLFYFAAGSLHFRVFVCLFVFLIVLKLLTCFYDQNLWFFCWRYFPPEKLADCWKIAIRFPVCIFRVSVKRTDITSCPTFFLPFLPSYAFYMQRSFTKLLQSLTEILTEKCSAVVLLARC